MTNEITGSMNTDQSEALKFFIQHSLWRGETFQFEIYDNFLALQSQM